MADGDLPPPKRGKYKTWLFDSNVAIPRTTKWRLGLQQEQTRAQGQGKGNQNQDDHEDFNEYDIQARVFEPQCLGELHPDTLDLESGEFEIRTHEGSDVEELIFESDSDSELEDEMESGDLLMTDIDDTDSEAEGTDNVPLYKDATVTKLAAHAIVHLFILEHKLSNQALNDLIRMLNVLLPEGHKFARSGYLLKKYFLNLFQEPLPKKHKYCGTCFDFLPSSTNICSNKVCQEMNCPVEEFLEVDICNQLARLYKGDFITKFINNTFHSGLEI